MTAFYPYARENHQRSLPGRVSSCTSVACLSLPLPSSPQSQCIHNRHINRLSRLSSISARAVQQRRGTAWSISKSYSPKSMSSEAQTVSFWGTFNEGFGGDDASQEPQRAARSKQIDRAPIGRCARPQRRFGIWPRSKRDEPGTGSAASPRQTPHNCLDGFISAIFASYRQVATAEPRTRHGQMPKSQWKRRDLGHEVGQPWLQRPSQNARDSARPAG